MRVPRWIAALAAVVGGALGWPAPAAAAPGDLDPTFGASGLFVSEQGSTEAAAMALQTDGKIVVVGTMSNQFVVYRLTASGSLDASFGGDGIVDVTGFLGSADEVGGGQALALQPDGKIVVAGGVAASAVVGDMAVARLNADGSLDAAFGGDGRVVVDFGAFSDWAYAVAVQSDNKIVVAGWMTQSRDDRFALARLGPDGVLDPSFDGDGRAVVDITSGAAQTDTDGVRDMVLLPDGKIVVAGIASERSGSSVQDMDFCVARFNTNGSLDTTFGGGDGHTEVDFLGFRDIGQAVARQADGKIVIGGWASTSAGEDDFGLARLTSAGDLDTTFGGDGRATVDFPDPAPGHIHDGLSDLALDADGRIVAVGSASSTFETVIDGNISLAGCSPTAAQTRPLAPMG